ncbi:MAG: aminotransferase class I/II-fold pyridoxal phosphate-dependent enzyme, partial [Desulfobacterota bacterium]|nr:aminotransferase class I/II-fold pyridoxal phosphate-dependent enzyme [Thermodesulfobacteriota bacterium]
MDPLAQELNEIIQKQAPTLFQMLSRLGKALYFPKGILSQTAEAQKKATKYNATTGIATEGAEPMYLPCVQKWIRELPPQETYTYAAGAGKPQLREKWREKLLNDNPSLHGKIFSLPMVTGGITHGLEVVSDLFIDPGDAVISPDKYWENYNLIFEVRKEAKIHTFPLFDSSGKFNTPGLKNLINELSSWKEKLILIFNFPNNPTGYTISPEEGKEIIEAIYETAQKGTNLV